MRNPSRLYDPNSMNIIPRFNVGDILYNLELEVVAYLIERRFVGIKNYSYQEIKTMLNGRPPYMESWYYKFKCTGTGLPLFEEWKSEAQVEDFILKRPWKYKFKGG